MATERKNPPPPAPSEPPAPGTVPRLPQTIFNLEQKGSTPNGNKRSSARK